MISLFLPEKRADSVGYGPLDDFWYGPVARTVSSRVNVNENTALNYSACWAATRLLAGTSGWLSLNLYKRESGGGKGIATDDRRNYCVDCCPNDQMIPTLFKSQTMNQQINWGNGYAEIQLDTRGNLAALWPIHASRVDPLIGQDDGKLWYKVRNNAAPPTYIESKDILHFPSIISDDGIVGKGVVRHAREAIGMGLATERYGASWFGKGGIPRAVVTHPTKMSDTARVNFRNDWKEIYGGPDGEKVALLQEGATMAPLNISNDDSQFLETRQFNIEEIARWYGVPPHMIQHLLRATFNNIEQLGIEFVKYSLMPWLVIWEQELNKKLLNEDEQKTIFFKFNVTQLLRGDAASRTTYWNTLINTGIACRNEARIAEDMNPVEGGDTFLAQGAMFALDENGVPVPPGQTAVYETVDSDDEADDQGNDADEAEGNEEPSKDDNPAQNDGHDSDNDSNTANVIQAVRTIFQGSLQRMIRKEATAARHAARKPGEFLKWMDEFYPKHTEQLTEAMTCSVDAANLMGYSIDAPKMVEEFIALSRKWMLDTADKNTASTFADSIEVVVKHWEDYRAATIADSIFKKETAI